VVVEKADRLARDLIIGELILRQFREAGVQVIEAEGGNDLTAGNDNPTSTLIRQILGAVSEFEKSSLVLKLRAARERKKKETGRCGGSYPFGHYPGEKETLKKMLDGHRIGYSTRSIATVLNEQKCPSRSGKPWTHGAVAKILKNQKP
jgi:DNA invertase Pin-like site-specific DNA recombinase